MARKRVLIEAEKRLRTLKENMVKGELDQQAGILELADILLAVLKGARD